MKTLVNYRLFVTFITLMILAAAAHASANWTVQERYTNGESDTAFDLTKILLGHYVIDDAYHTDKFARYEVTYPHDSLTVIHWYDGFVAPGDSTWACFEVRGGGRVTVICALWTRADGTFIGSAGPNLEAHAYTGDTVSLAIRNSWRQWLGAGYPILPGDWWGPAFPYDISLSNVGYFTTNVLRPMSELNDSLLYSASWTYLDDATLPFDSTTLYTLGPLDDSVVVVFCCDVSANGMTTTELFQFRVRTEVPALTDYGLYALLALIILAAAFAFYKRRSSVRTV